MAQTESKQNGNTDCSASNWRRCKDQWMKDFMINFKFCDIKDLISYQMAHCNWYPREEREMFCGKWLAVRDEVFQRLIAYLGWPSETCVEVKVCISLQFTTACRERFSPVCYTVPLNCVQYKCRHSSMLFPPVVKAETGSYHVQTGPGH